MMPVVTTIRPFLAVAVFAWLSVAGARPAAAHQIWIEQDGKGARLYFGEFADNLREDSPGLLDKLGRLTVKWLSPQGEQAVVPVKAATSYTLDRRAGKGESIVAEETSYPVWESKEGTKVVRTAWTPAARFVSDFAARTPSLTLDLVPTGTPHQFQAFYKGKPLADAKVKVLAASGWAREGVTDASGKVSFQFPWKGAYVVEVQHTDATPGKRPGASGEEKFDTAMFVTTLSFVIRTGLTAPPAPAPAPPSE